MRISSGRSLPWENYHLYQFTVGERVYGKPTGEEELWGQLFAIVDLVVWDPVPA